MHTSEYSKTITMQLSGINKTESISMFQFFSSKVLKLVPMITMDFSQANLTFDDDICLHRTKAAKPKIYLKLINTFLKEFKSVSEDFLLAYAFGWKAIAGTETSDGLALSGDYFNPELTFNKIEERYLKTVNQIEFALPPNHSYLFDKFAKLARVVQAEHLKNYFVHLHITPGLIEDYNKLVQTIVDEAKKSHGKH